MKNFAFIFARSGSKGLPNKNLKILKGKTLLEHSIAAAKRSELISKIFVSSDCEKILSLATNQEVISIPRPKNLATDRSPEWLSWKHAISWVEKNYEEFNNFVSLPTTSPLRRIRDINKAIEMRAKGKADIVIGVSESDHNPYFNMVEMDSNDSLRIIPELDQKITRRQDQPKIFNITTAVYVTSPSFIKNNDGIFDGKVAGVIIPKKNAIDIDDIYDFKYAESLLEDSDYEYRE